MHVYQKSRFKRKLLCAAISLSLLPLAGATLAQDDAPIVEEVIVTGSYIRRSEGFRSASPITQISMEDIALAGTPNMGDVIHNLNFNMGTTVTANAFTGAENISTTLNLRGLGSGATLDLVDGYRSVNSDINSILPQIAIQRLDIVTDGAAALYGSEAVAGVVNYVPIKSYDGFKFEHMSQGDSSGDYNDVQFGMIWGTDFNGIDVVVAADWREHSRLEMRDRPETLLSAFVWSSTATPGDYRVPTRDENGVLTGSTQVTSDPGCGQDGHDDPTKIKNGEFGFQRSPTNCAYDYGEFWDYRYPLQRGNLYTSASYDFSDDLTVSTQYYFNSIRFNVRGSPINPGGRTTELPVVRGEIPGNPFPAVDANGNPVLAQDANGDGIPDRVGDMFSTVILDPLNGIPFNEDVFFSSWRPWAKHGTLPSIFNSDGSSPRDSSSWTNRWVIQAEFTVPYLEGWEGHAGYMWSQFVDESKIYEGSFGGLLQGLSCDVATDRPACFTPFVTPNPADLNTQAVADSTVNFERDRDEFELQTFDLVINGTVPLGSFELPGGALGAAIGYQRRQERFQDTPAPFQLKNDQWIGAQQFINDGGRSVDAFFLEFAVPLLDNLELQLAVRNEDYSTGQSSTDPKYGVVYSPFDFLSFRASAGTAFIAPSLNDLTAPQACGLANIADPFTEFAAFTSSCRSGNPNLTPESADTLSYGFDWDIIDGMRLSVTYSETDFTDRIVSSNSQDILDTDFFNFEQAFGDQGGAKPSLANLNAWLSSGASDPRVIRDPNDPGQIVRVFNGRSNASTMLVKAYDVTFSYQFQLPDMLGLSDIGSFNFNLAGTYLDEYSFQLTPLVSEQQAVGHRNWRTGAVPPMPRIKASLRLGWVNGNHSVSMISRYLHSLRYEGFQGNFLAGLNSRVVPKFVSEFRKSHIEDFSYNYRGYEALGGVLNLTVGARNVFDRRPQRISELGGTEERLYDTMGRMIYVRVSYEL